MNHLFSPLLPKDPLQGPVLVLAAHPDDEVIGAGGMLAHHAARGHEVVVVHARAVVPAVGSGLGWTSEAEDVSHVNVYSCTGCVPLTSVRRSTYLPDAARGEGQGWPQDRTQGIRAWGEGLR